jgi:cyanophycinase
VKRLVYTIYGAVFAQICKIFGLVRFYKKYVDTGDRSLPGVPKQTGRLAIIGGRLEADNSTLFSAMKPLCNGRIAVIPVASDIPREVGAETVESFVRNGIRAEMLPLFWRRRADAFDPTLVERVESCGSVFFTGGDQSRIIHTLVQDGEATPLLKSIRTLHANGGLVAGSSAGAAIMSRRMILGGTSNEALSHGLVDDPDIPGLALGKGLDFFPWGVVDQHFIARGRIGRLVVAVRAAGERIGFGIDENTALIVDGEQAVVRGETGVVIVDLGSARNGDDNSIEDVIISYLDDGDEYDLRRNKILPCRDKKLVRVSRSSFRGPAPVKRCAFGIYTLLDLMLRLARADPSCYTRDSVSSWPDKGDVEWNVEIERVPRQSRALSALRDGRMRFTVIDYRLSIHRGERVPASQSPSPIHPHHRKAAPLSQLVLLGNSPLQWRGRHLDGLKPYLRQPVGVMATASGQPRRVALDYVDWLRRLGIMAEELHVNENNIERRNRDSAFLRKLGRMGTIIFTGGNQRRLTKILTYRGDVTAVLEHLIEAFENGTNLIAVAGAAAAFGQPMIAEGDSFEALRFGASEDAGSEGMVMEPGLGLFEAGIVDQNFVARSRLGRLVVACAEENVHYGFGLCEESGLVVSEDKGLLSAIGREGFVVVAMKHAGLSATAGSFRARGIELQLVQPGNAFDVHSGITLNTQSDGAASTVEDMVMRLTDDCNEMFRSRSGSSKEGWLNVAFNQGPPATLDIESQRVRY